MYRPFDRFVNCASGLLLRGLAGRPPATSSVRTVCRHAGEFESHPVLAVRVAPTERGIDFHGSGQSSILTVDVRASQGVNTYTPPFITQTLRQ